MPSVTITTAEKVEIQDSDTGVGLEDRAVPNTYLGSSSDTSVAIVADSGHFTLSVHGVAPGTATITVTRTADGVTATGEVTVEEAPVAPFEFQFGTPEPK